LKKVKVQDAVGLTLAHDITEIVPQKKKDVAFRRGKIIELQDVEKLLDLGKNYVYVTDGLEKAVHEDEAAQRIAEAVTDEHMELLPPKEGRVNIVSKVTGLLRVNKARLNAINSVDDVLLTTIPDRYPVKPGDLVAATRIVPLAIEEKALRKAERLARQGIIRILPFKALKAGLVVTGTEVFTGRIKDGSPAVEERLKNYGLQVVGKEFAPDDITSIKEAIMRLFERGADLVITTGGLSVDPDDVTREGIAATGAKILAYGAPVFPGAMFLLARRKGKYVLGAPACVYYSRNTILDIVLPPVMAGLPVTKRDILELAHGGLCINCPECHYPNCFFGKGT
jgi:molybdenum cofactor synthesis domain-containing protein